MNAKHLITTIAVVLISILAGESVNALDRGEKSFGLSSGYVSRNESAMAGVYFQWNVAKHVRMAPRASYIFRHEGTDAYDFDIDVHFPYSLDSADKWRVFPIVGVGHYSWNHHEVTTEDDQFNDVSTRTSRLCANAGVGVEFLASPTLKLSLQGRGSFMKQSSTAAVSVSIGYIF